MIKRSVFMQERRIIVSCGIFENELKEILKNESRFKLDFIFLKSGYHTRLDLLNLKFSELLAENDLKDSDIVRIFFGEHCLLSVDALRNGKYKILPTNNCLSAMVGIKRLKELESDKTLVITAAWVKQIFFAEDPELFIWDPYDFRANFGRYERILVLDTGFETLSEEEILTLFDLTETIVEVEKWDLSCFRKLALDFIV
jgi:hypothetical protein